MADQSLPSTPGSSSPQRRRSSITELFTSRPVLNTSVSPSPSPTTAPSPVPPAQPRKAMSIATLGLGGGSPTAGSPFTAFAKQRRASVATSSASGSPEFRNSFSDEPAVLEEGDSTTVPLNPPGSPSLARRMSFGAQALRDVKQGGSPAGGGRRLSTSLFAVNENVNPNGTPASIVGSPQTATPAGKGRGRSSLLPLSPSSPNSPTSMSTSLGVLQLCPYAHKASDQLSLTHSAGEGFNWSDALRDKTKRSPSFSSTVNPFAGGLARNRSVSGGTTEPPKEMPKPAAPPPQMKKPDHMGERMLRGDFMID
jgi:hypothetical protein